MEFCIWNRCNNRCVMCTNPFGFGKDDGSFPYTLEPLLSRIKSQVKGLRNTNETICLTGGEPTIHPDFFKILSFLREECPDNEFAIATNGRIFSYEEFTKKFLKFGPFQIKIAVHGPSAELHDGITRVKGSFDQTIKGIENILKYKRPNQFLEIRIVLMKQNYKHLDELLGFIYHNFKGISSIAVIFPEMEGTCGDNIDWVGITYKEIKKDISQAIKKWKDSFQDRDFVRVYHFPLCAIDQEVWPYAWRTLRGDEITFQKQCKKCLYKNYCLGIHWDYLRLVGGDEFKPITKKITITKNSNPDQFEYHPIISVKSPKEK